MANNVVPIDIKMRQKLTALLNSVPHSVLIKIARCTDVTGHWIGKYRADYSSVTAEEIAAPDSDLDDLYRNSIPTDTGSVT